MTIRELAQKGYEIDAKNGFYPNDLSVFRQADVDAILAKLALIGTEVSEAVEEIRKAQPDALHLSEELGDIIIRALGLGYALGLDVQLAIDLKLERNAARGFRHGGKRA